MLQERYIDRPSLDDLPSVRLVRLAELVARSAIKMIEKRFGVKHTELRILTRLGGADGITTNELARQLDVDKGWISRSLRALEDRGLVQRIAHPTDTRAAYVRLTPAGHELGRRMIPYSQAHNDRLLDGMNRAEVDRVLDGLRVRAELLLLDNDL